MVDSADLEFRSVSDAVTKAFLAHGVVCLRGFVTAEWVELLRDAVDAAIAKPKQDMTAKARNGFITEARISNHRGDFRRFIEEAAIGELAASVLGCREVRLYNDTIFVKEPGSPEPTPWHQDLPYFNLSAGQTCSSWLALDRVTAASGAMSFVAGSHLWNKMYQPRKLGLDSSPVDNAERFDGPVPDIDAEPAQFNVVSFDLEPGDVTFHHLLTLHKAGPNTTAATRRRAHTMRMVGEDVEWVDRVYSTGVFSTELKTGDKLRGESFPLLWPRSVQG